LFFPHLSEAEKGRGAAIGGRRTVGSNGKGKRGKRQKKNQILPLRRALHAERGDRDHFLPARPVFSAFPGGGGVPGGGEAAEKGG
jgi:hypothetical protein